MRKIDLGFMGVEGKTSGRLRQLFSSAFHQQAL
jgi:hypothetical protein